MADLASLSFRVDSTPLARAQRDLRNLGRQGQDTGRQVARASDQMGQSVTRLAKSFAGLVSAGVAARAVFGASESYARMSNALRGMGLSAGQAAATLEQVSDIANRTRTPLEATAQLYQRISIAGRDLGASQQDVLRFTENVGLALATSGTSAQEASGALLQLSQAMAGGTVRAEEFNSILEGAFPIAQAAANAIDGAGGSVGRLRQMVVDGKVSSKEFFDAILESSDALEAAFGQTVPTVGQAMTVLGNSFTMAIGGLDGITGASGAAAQAIMFLAENVDRAIVYAGTAAVAFGTVYAAGLVKAAVATHGLSGALRVLRGALIRTGIGALVVIAGELVFQLVEVSRKVGGVGKAFGLMWDVAKEVTQNIGAAWGYVEAQAKAAAFNMAAYFLEKIGAIAHAFVQLTHTIAKGFNAVFETNLSGIDYGVLTDLYGAISDVQFAAQGANNELKQTSDTFLGSLESLDALNAAMAENVDTTNGGAAAADRLAEALAGQGGSGKGGAAGAAGKLSEEAKAAAKRLDELKSVAESWTDRTATPVEKYRKELAELNEVAEAGLVGDETYARGVKQLNVELADSLPMIGDVADAFGDWVSRGFDDFKGFTRSILDSFKNMLSQMIAMAAKNQIMIGLGFGGAGAGAAGGIMAGAAGSGIGGMLGGIGATVGAMGSTFMANAGAMLTGAVDMAGFASTMGSAFSSLQGFAAAAGAIAVPLAAATAAFTFFRKTTKKMDEGIRLTTEGMRTAVEQWEEIRTKQFWGLKTSRKTHFSGAGREIANPLSRAVEQMQTGIMDAAAALGVGKRAFRDFSHHIMLSTEDMTEEEAIKALQEELGGLGEAFARMVPGARRLRMEGESTVDALTRTATALGTVNAAFQSLGVDGLAESLRGGRIANRLVEASGGLQQFAAATEHFFQNILSAPDRLKALTDRLDEGLRAANIKITPRNENHFQKMFERMMGNGARKKGTALLNLGPLFSEIQKLEAELDNTGKAAGNAADRLAERERRQADKAREREGLERQIMRLEGDRRAIRRAELADLYPANRALQRRIYGLEREAAAAERAAERQRERAGLQTQLWTLLGRENKLRAQALADLAPMNRAMQERIWRIQDEQEATERAAQAAEERQSKLAAIADERSSLETRLLELQGNTAALRARELEALNPANRALQRMIWGLEDAQEAMDALDPAAFVSRLDFERARASGRIGGMTSTGIPLAVVPPTSPAKVNAETAELLRVAREILKTAQEEKTLTANIERDTRRHTQIAVRQDEEARAAS